MKKAITEIRGMDTHDLRGKLAELRKEQFDMRFHGAAEQVARPSRHKEIRRTIARIQLVLAERGDSAAEPKQASATKTAAASQTTASQTAASQSTASKTGGKKR
jgi:large subunit ribosomal protein L29